MTAITVRKGGLLCGRFVLMLRWADQSFDRRLLVARWLSGNAGLRLNQAHWPARTYRRYLTAKPGWADELSVAAGELRACIFSAQARKAGGQWA
jgi:hypothetical protein